MVLEGHITITAMSFAITFGYFNFGIIFILAFLGDIVGDFIWYAIGRFGTIAFINRFGHIFKSSEKRVKTLNYFFEKHPIKTLMAIKLSPIIPMPGLIIAGSSGMSVKKFFISISIIIIPKTLLFMALGYFFGNAYSTLSNYINNALYAIGIIIILAWLTFYGYRKLTKRFSEKLEE